MADEVTAELERRLAELDPESRRAKGLQEAKTMWQELERVRTGGATPSEARVAAGLRTLGQAARVTGLSRERLREIEGGAAMTDGEREALTEAYACEGFAPAVPT